MLQSALMLLQIRFIIYTIVELFNQSVHSDRLSFRCTLIRKANQNSLKMAESQLRVNDFVV